MLRLETGIQCFGGSVVGRSAVRCNGRGHAENLRPETRNAAGEIRGRPPEIRSDGGHFSNLFPLAAQPERNFVVIHDLVGNQDFSIVNEHHPPLQMHADFVGTPGQFSQSESAMLMRIAKSSADISNGLGGFFQPVK